MKGDSSFVSKGPCEGCGSSDANATYSDGHTFCFKCERVVSGSGDAAPRERKRRAGLLDGEVRGLHKRKITQATCEHFGYMVGEYSGKTVQIAPYYDRDGNMVAQHLRTQDKDFPWVGDPKNAAPFGFHAFPKSGRMLVITEGEVDAMALSQAQGNKWPVWSIGCGAGQGEATKVKKYIAERLDLFRDFEKIVLMFDNDEPGLASAKAAASVLKGKAFIASLPMKDASDMLMAGKVEELVGAVWRETQYHPEGMVDVSTLKDKVKEGVNRGESWGIPALDRMTYGRRRGEVYAFGAGTGVGKSDIFYQIMAHLITDLKVPVGTFLFEAEPHEVAQRVAGKIARKTFHVPDSGWTDDDFDVAWAQLEQSGKLYAYDSFGVNEWGPVKERIEYLAQAHGVKDFFIDHLTALAAWQEDERKALEIIMSEIGGLVKALDCSIYFVSHLTTPEGKPHEEGGRVTIRQFKGSRAIGYWSHFMFGLERDQQDEDALMRITTTLRCLKDRKTGRGTGQVAYMRYDIDTGYLSEVDISAPDSAEAAGFTNATGGTRKDF